MKQFQKHYAEKKKLGGNKSQVRIKQKIIGTNHRLSQ